jgi:hypothetical protein
VVRRVCRLRWQASWQAEADVEAVPPQVSGHGECFVESGAAGDGALTISRMRDILLTRSSSSFSDACSSSTDHASPQVTAGLAEQWETL